MKIRLRELRNSAGVTQQELADAVNVSSHSISRFESGARVPDLETAVRIADFFNVPLDILAGRSWPGKSSDGPLAEAAEAGAADSMSIAGTANKAGSGNLSVTRSEINAAGVSERSTPLYGRPSESDRAHLSRSEMDYIIGALKACSYENQLSIPLDGLPEDRRRILLDIYRIMVGEG